MKRWKRILGVATIALCAASSLFAQTTGRLDGRVVTDDGSALPGVTVTVTSPQLQGEKIAVTEADGGFRFVGIPVGEYKLVAQLDGFGITEYEGLAVRLDKTVSVEVELSAAIEDTITVTGDASVLIDHLSTTSGANFDTALVEDLPVARSAMDLALAAPGVVSGGMTGRNENNTSISGASAAENRYVVDGLDTTNAAFGTIGTTFPVEFIKEVEVKTGGYEAEYGGALGGLLNVITKSGGNNVSLDAFGYFTDDSLQSDPPVTATNGQFLGEEESDIGVAVGGKIKADKLWYFAAANATQNAQLVETRGGINTKDEDDDTLFYAGKLTWQLNPKNQLVFSAFGNPGDGRDVIRNSYGLVGTNDDFGANNYGITYNGTQSSNTFLEISAGTYDAENTSDPLTDTPRYDQRSFGANPGIAFLSTNPCGLFDANEFDSRFSFTADPSCSGATFVQENGDNSRDEVRGAFTWFADTGSVGHEIKVGATARSIEYQDSARYPGPAPGPFFDSTGVLVDQSGLRGQRWLLFNGSAILIEYDQNSDGQTDEEAIYLQDSLRIGDHVTLNLGVRADQFSATGNLSSSVQNQELDFGFSDMVAPRIGFTADVTRDGRSKLYGHFGRFYESVPLDINARAFGNEQFNFYYFYYPTDGSLPNAADPGTHYYTYLLGGGTKVDPTIDPMFTEEALLGFEYSVTDDISLGVKYIERSIEDVIEDISVDGGQTYFITNPGVRPFTSNPVTGAPVTDELGNPVSEVIFPTPVRDYTAFEFTVNKRFSHNWQLFASYVNSENEGNYGGLFRQDNGQLDPNITSLFDLPSLLDGAFGLLPNDREHQIKTYGSYLTPFNLSVGWFAQFLSGTPVSRLGAHPIYGANERFVTPRGAAGTTPDVYNLDLHFEYPLQVGGNMQIRLIGDIFNVTDEAEPVTVEQEWTTARLFRTVDPTECGGADPTCATGNPNFGLATQFQRPQTFRFGVKLSY